MVREGNTGIADSKHRRNHKCKVVAVAVYNVTCEVYMYSCKQEVIETVSCVGNARTRCLTHFGCQLPAVSALLNVQETGNAL
jgi:hypothetical protein